MRRPVIAAAAAGAAAHSFGALEQIFVLDAFGNDTDAELVDRFMIPATISSLLLTMPRTKKRSIVRSRSGIDVGTATRIAFRNRRH